MQGKHTEQSIEIKNLNEIIARQEKEIKDIKLSVSDILLEIRNLNESNDYNAPEVKRRKISELCTNTRYELLIDELDDNKTKAKIIELPTTNQSNK